MEVGTGLALLGSAKIVEKILGPTAEYIGKSLEAWTRQRVENVRRVFSSAQLRLGGAIDTPGQVPPKVLLTVLDGASESDDPLAAEYFGGVLASSRSTVNRDDRGASAAGLVRDLSTYQLRTHYLVYSTMATLFAGTRRRPQLRTGNLVLFIPFDAYCDSMDFTTEERTRAGALLTHSFYGLAAKDLIGERWLSGEPDHLNRGVEGDCTVHTFVIPKSGVVVAPTVFGLQLLAWAHGKGDVLPDGFFAPGFEVPPLAGILPIAGAQRLSDFQRDATPAQGKKTRPAVQCDEHKRDHHAGPPSVFSDPDAGG